MATSPLFDTAAAWLDSPRQAFEAYLASEDFVLNSRGKPRAGEKIREGSAAVYMSQWSKFERWLEYRRIPFAAVDTLELSRFLEEGLNTGRTKPPSPATRQRYMQLLERIYARALSLGAIKTNPAAKLLSDRRFTATRAAMPTNASRATVARLQNWLRKKLEQALEHSGIERWREARDVAMASLALGSGLRCKELAVLSTSQIRQDTTSEPKARYQISITRTQTTATARTHSCVTDPFSTVLLEAWLAYRSDELARHMREGRSGDVVFPADLNDVRSIARLSDSAIYVNLKRLADEAVEAGALDEDTRWILATGASGLRRARILVDLKNEVDKDLMTIRLGYWEERAVRRYQEELDKSR